MVADAKDSNTSKLELFNLPGGPRTFELAMKFCGGMNYEILSVINRPGTNALCCGDMT